MGFLLLSPTFPGMQADMDTNISATRTSHMANETGIVGLAGPSYVHAQVCTCTHVPCVHIQCVGTSVGDSCGCELPSPLS